MYPSVIILLISGSATKLFRNFVAAAPVTQVQAATPPPSLHAGNLSQAVSDAEAELHYQCPVPDPACGQPTPPQVS